MNGQECTNDVSVQQSGSSRESQRSQLIVQSANFTCSGVITHITASLHKSGDSGSLPSIQVWRLAQNSSDEYNKIAEVQLVESSLEESNGYSLANMSLDNRIPFQAGDVIGYYHPPSSFYLVNSITTQGYLTYRIAGEENSRSRLKLSEAIPVLRLRPLIQFSYIVGKNYIVFVF